MRHKESLDRGNELAGSEGDKVDMQSDAGTEYHSQGKALELQKVTAAAG
jgi:hypothetical protein